MQRDDTVSGTNPQIAQMAADSKDKKTTRLERGLLVNFGRQSLDFKRFVFSNLRKSARSADER
jgi:hypothetical protein